MTDPTIRRVATPTTPLRQTTDLPAASTAQPAATGAQPAATGAQPAATGAQPAAAGAQTAVTGDQRVATPGAAPTADRVQTALLQTPTPAAGSTSMGGALERRQAAQQAANWARDTRAGLNMVAGGTATPATIAQTASLLQRPEQIQAARDALRPIANTDAGQTALAQLNEIQGITTTNRAGVERNMGRSLQNQLRTNQSLAGVHSDQQRQDLAAFAGRDPASKAAHDRIAARPPQAGEFDAGRLAVSNPAAVATQDRAMAASPNQAAAREAMARQAVQGLADQSFGRVDAGGNGTVPDATKALDAGIQRLRDAGVDGPALDRARRAVTQDPSNQTMLANPGHDALGRLAIRTGVADLAAAPVNSFFDSMIGPRVEGQRPDNAGLLSHITDRIPPGGARTVALEGSARFGAVELGAGASMSIARTQPQGDPPSTRLQVTFAVEAHAAAGFERAFGKQTEAGGVTGQVELQARVDGRASFTYEFDTGNPQQMAQLSAMSGALVRAIPGAGTVIAGTVIAGTEGPGVQEAFRGLSERHVETNFEASVTATARLELTASSSDRSEQLVARFHQTQAGLTQVQALTGSVQAAYGALGKSPPDFQAAFGAMESHLPAGAVQAGQVLADARRAQSLYAEGKTGEALQIMQSYLPQGLRNAATVATDASRAYQAMSSGNAAEALQIMQTHLPPGGQSALQVAQDAQRAQALHAEGKTGEAMEILRGYLPTGLQAASQVGLDAFRAQQLVRDGNPAEAFQLMQQHLPPGARSAAQVGQDAQRAQALVAEGKHTEALALLTPYMPAGVSGTIGQAQAGLATYNAVREAFDRGDLAGGLTAMQSAVTAGQGLAGALRQQAADLPGQIAAARAAIQTVREMPAQLAGQIRNLPARAREQVQGLLTQASEQVQGLRAQAQALTEQARGLPAAAQQQLQAQARALTQQAQTQARALTEQARALPADIRQGVMDRINAATATPTAVAAPVGSIQLTGSGTARVSQRSNHRDGSSTTTFGLSGEGTVAAESRLVGQTGASGARSSDIAVTRGADGQISGVTITRSFEGSRFAATAGRELVGELDPNLIASVEARDRVAVVQQIDMAAQGITPSMTSTQVAQRLATLALRADPPAGTGRVVRATATRTDSVQARADFVVGSVAVRLDRTTQRELRT